MPDVLCGLWTEHRINSRDEGWTDYRDSPPTSSLLCALSTGMTIVETSDPEEPCAHVLRYTGTYTDLDELLDSLHNDGWETWLALWKETERVLAGGAAQENARSDETTERIEKTGRRLLDEAERLRAATPKTWAERLQTEDLIEVVGLDDIREALAAGGTPITAPVWGATRATTTIEGTRWRWSPPKGETIDMDWRVLMWMPRGSEVTP